ncbi:hypothetical protein OJ997_16830 [Solirubrobacter phytolaccae]|uniref:Outer membrane protein assembly factor BamE n=1 Tax=Solirubrobacter phytolaccae TaxID=1404360 RepID=A0A9X3S9X5_9ACTN|nr:hypothetical protein [Solirubrobacter phytolaccae]MDA0181971.1 hypothetical protein [Solirubrobacter phytolaccae]
MRWLAIAILALACSGCVTTKAKWDPAAYRAAIEARDEKEQGRQARAAERDQALVGLTRKRVRAVLGSGADWPTVFADRDYYPAGDNGSIVDRDELSLEILYDRSGRVTRVDYNG